MGCTVACIVGVRREKDGGASEGALKLKLKGREAAVGWRLEWKPKAGTEATAAAVGGAAGSGRGVCRMKGYSAALVSSMRE